MTPGEKYISITVPQNIEPVRIDRFLTDSAELELSRSQIQQLITGGQVTVAGKAIGKNLKLSGGEIIELVVPPPRQVSIEAENIPLDIVFEDDFLAIINKPPGLVVHPAPGNPEHTLVNALLYHLGKLSSDPEKLRPGIIHRLDKDTSGLLLVAKDDDTARKLREQMAAREIEKTYLALVCGHLSDESGTIDLPIGRSLKDRKKMTVTNLHSRASVTHYRLKERFRTLDFVELKLETGRTHQIRVHFAHVNHPVFGDGDYGGRHKWIRGVDPSRRREAQKILDMIDRQALHAYRLELKHPQTGKPLMAECEPPDDFSELLKYLRENYRY